jgi:hypothetical protein
MRLTRRECATSVVVGRTQSENRRTIVMQHKIAGGKHGDLVDVQKNIADSSLRTREDLGAHSVWPSL